MRHTLLMIAAAIASPPEGLERGRCDHGPGAAGADSYFVGELRVDDGQVTGSETWVLFANDKWKAAGGTDCEIVWTLEGKSTVVGSNLALSLSATPQAAFSTCPDELLRGRRSPHSQQRVGGEAEPWKERYAVKIDGEEAEVLFAESARRIGAGTYAGGVLKYVSDHQCKWF